MLSVFIYETNWKLSQKIEKMLNNQIMIEEFDMKVMMKTNEACKLVTYLVKNSQVRGIYLIDIDGDGQMAGLELGKQIRNIDPLGKIVLLTNDIKKITLSFDNQIEAIAYIVKDDYLMLREKTLEVLNQGQRHYQLTSEWEPNLIKLKIGSRTCIFSLSDIMFIETTGTPHKLRLHLVKGQLEFYGKLKAVECLSPELLSSHKSCVVNSKNIREINRKQKEITMVNGEKCLLSLKKFKELPLSEGIIN